MGSTKFLAKIEIGSEQVSIVLCPRAHSKKHSRLENALQKLRLLCEVVTVGRPSFTIDSA